MPTPVMVNVAPFVPVIVAAPAALVVSSEKTTGLPDAPPVALSVYGPPPKATGEVIPLKPVMGCAVEARAVRVAVPEPPLVVSSTVKVAVTVPDAAALGV